MSDNTDDNDVPHHSGRSSPEKVITPPADPVRAPLAEPEQESIDTARQHRHRESIWDEYGTHMTDEALRKRRLSRRRESFDQAKELAALGKPDLSCTQFPGLLVWMRDKCLRTLNIPPLQPTV